MTEISWKINVSMRTGHPPMGWSASYVNDHHRGSSPILFEDEDGVEAFDIKGRRGCGSCVRLPSAWAVGSSSSTRTTASAAPRASSATTTPGGKAMFQMMGVFAEFERAMIAERVRAGLERAKAQGNRLAGTG